MVAKMPEKYTKLTDEEVETCIRRAREQLGSDLVILGHHYQRDPVLKFADYTGDSLLLAKMAAEQPEAKYVIFCGVLFMAETADILASDHQTIILPNTEAGCPMADMAEKDQLEKCWKILTDRFGKDIIPITYVNSSADVKAFCGARGGATCTSSSAIEVMEWALNDAGRVLFLPDQHLGRNTGQKLGLLPEEIALYEKEQQKISMQGDNPRLILWNGYCPVHMEFCKNDVERIKKDNSQTQIAVHPECRSEVVRAADEDGSTEYLREIIDEAPAGSSWAVGTEVKLVSRLSQQHPDKSIVSLNKEGSICEDMDLIDSRHLLWILDELLEGEVANRIKVSNSTAKDARRALQRMFDILRG